MRTVLLVDDSRVALRALARRLIAAGFDVLEELTAASARERDSGGLSCAVLDLELGEADGSGAELAASLHAKSPTLPIAFFTAGASPPLVTRACAFGPIFRKPNVDVVVAWALRAAR
jgi:DNA-binding response OmpR family regulator